MEKILLTLLTLGLFTLANAQSVPDFVTTDVNGNKHQLYEYLEAGQYVLLGFVAEW